MVPTMFVRLLKLPEETRAHYDLSSLRHVIHAAAPCPADVKRAMIDWWGPVIYEFYGSTESGAVTFCTREESLTKPGTVGALAPGANCASSTTTDEILPQGELGEIFCGSRTIRISPITNRPDKRGEIERDGFITSGDVGYLDADGYLFICDRKRDMVISGGVNIYPAEIEVRAACHARRARLRGVRHSRRGVRRGADGGDRAAARRGARPRVGAADLHKALADYKVPKRIEIPRDLPREDSGKIFKRRLRDPYWAKAGRTI